MNFQMFKLVLEKAEETEIKLPTSAGSLKKQESSRKKSISALLTMSKSRNGISKVILCKALLCYLHLSDRFPVRIFVYIHGGVYTSKICAFSGMLTIIQ